MSSNSYQILRHFDVGLELKTYMGGVLVFENCLNKLKEPKKLNMDFI